MSSDQFLEAQKRYAQGRPFGSHFMQGYTRDLLQNYGDGGRRISLPNVSQKAFEDGLKFRAAEKQRYADLERQLNEARNINHKFASFINSLEFLDENEEHVGGGGGRRDGDGRGSGGGGVLPPVQADTNHGQAQELISSRTPKHERPDGRSADPVGNRTMEQPISIPERGEPGAEGGEPPPREEEHEAADAGGVDAADTSEPNLG